MTNNPRCVVDTNVLISAALVKAGKPYQVVNWIVQHGVMLASEATFEEVATTLARPRFRKYLDSEDRADYLNFIHGNSRFIKVTEHITECRDPKDDMFLELAIGGQADLPSNGSKTTEPPGQARHAAELREECTDLFAKPDGIFSEPVALKGSPR